MRHALGFTGTHIGCEHGVCGACTVMLDGAAVRSCLILAIQADGGAIMTVEGLGVKATRLSPAAGPSFRRHHALQCGFCTPGILMSAHALLSEELDADADRAALRRECCPAHICRCTGYVPIVPSAIRASDARAAHTQGVDPEE